MKRLDRCGCFAAALGCCALLACQSGVDPTPPAAHVEHVEQALRPTPGSEERPPLFDRGDTIETFDSAEGFFRVHYSRSGRHAVPSSDADRDGVPDYVNTVAKDYEEVLSFYRELGYREPLRDGDVPVDNGGDDRFDVYLLDFPNSADGEFRTDACGSSGCSGHMLLENDFDGRHYASPEAGIRLVSSHEFFHAVQHAYVPDPSPVIGEGTAVWASEAFDRAAGDLEAQAPGYLDRTERSLGQDVGGPVDPFTYGSALFFEFLDESVERPLLRKIWERLAESPGSKTWLDALDELLDEDYASSLGSEFSTFAGWNLFTASRADPARGYAYGGDYPSVDEREIDQPYADKELRVFPLAARYHRLTAAADATLEATADLPGDDELPGVELMIAVEHAGALGELKRSAGQRALEAQLQAAAGDTLHVVLLNTRLDGDSLKPALCVGTTDEVASCRSGDAGAGTDAPKKPDRGCSVSRPGQRPHPGLALMMLMAAALFRSRRRRS